MLSLIVFGLLGPSLACPITGAQVSDGSPAFAVSGVQFRFRDEEAKATFQKDPVASLASYKGSAPVGVSFFDPVARKSMILSRDGVVRQADLQAVSIWEPYRGVLYPLGTARSVRTFRSNPAAYVEEPKRFTLWCPIMLKASPSIERAIGYVDREGVRFYLCCESCIGSARGSFSGPGWGEAIGKAEPWLAILPRS